MLGGVEIPYRMGLQGHSDADAALHAVTDAVLGAAGLPDIGTCFPDSDPALEKISSRVLLGRAHQMAQARGFEVENLDIVIVAEKPRISPYVESMRVEISHILGLSGDEVGIKATTMEGKGPIGRGEGVAVQAVVLLRKESALG